MMSVEEIILRQTKSQENDGKEKQSTSTKPGKDERQLVLAVLKTQIWDVS